MTGEMILSHTGREGAGIRVQANLIHPLAPGCQGLRGEAGGGNTEGMRVTVIDKEGCAAALSFPSNLSGGKKEK